MLISIVTPSFRNSNWLKLCIASVADQEGVEVEHIVQDAGSDDGTLDWLPHDRRVKAYVESDAGMYDAVNRGLRKSGGEILAYLNCDEQYLPGALQGVHDYFTAHPEIEVAVAHTVIVDARGQFICYRKAIVPRKHHILVCHLATLTCATFFRRRVMDQYGLLFDSRWRALGDADWMVRLLESRVRLGVLPRYTSVFADTGENMGMEPNAHRERQEMFRAAPFWAQKLTLGLHATHWTRRLLHGNYCQRPFSYAIYTLDSPTQRIEHYVSHPTFLWKERLQQGVLSTAKMSWGTRSGRPRAK
jgi:glycosyltransferase involved in cell wall biosynthesis